jgi:proteasome lid subunit RPN8/RPN11
MSASLAISPQQHKELLAHMQASGDEQVAFLFTEPTTDAKPTRVMELYRVPPEGFVDQSPHHLALTDEVRAYVIKHAWELGGSLAEVHSHESGPPAWFSPTDLDGFDEWVPHVRWRLAGRPYIAIVFADESFDALVWEDDVPGPLSALHVGDASLKPTGITYANRSGQSHG